MRDYKASLYLNGASYVTSGANTGLSGDVPFTTSSWCFLRIASYTYNTIAKVGTAGAGTGIWLNALITAGLSTVADALLVGVVDKYSTLTVPLEKWFHMTLIYSGSQAFALYINGELALSTTFGGAVNLGNAPFVVGNSGGAYCFVNDACLWSRALTATEVYQMAKFGVVPTTNLIRRYPLDEGQGTVATDISATGDNGAITSGAWSLQSANKLAPVLRNLNTSVVINATSASMQSNSNTGITGTAAFSMTSWFQIFQVPTGYCWGLMLGTSGGLGHSVALGSYTSGKICVSLEGTGYVYSTAGILQVGRWQHFGMSVSAAGLVHLYLDGALVGQGSPGTFAVANGPFFFGNIGVGNTPIGGSVADSCLWSRELTANEFYQMHRFGITPTINLIRRYKLQAGSGTVAIDSSVTGDNGTITNGVWSPTAPMRRRIA